MRQRREKKYEVTMEGKFKRIYGRGEDRHDVPVVPYEKRNFFEKNKEGKSKYSALGWIPSYINIKNKQLSERKMQSLTHQRGLKQAGMNKKILLNH